MIQQCAQYRSFSPTNVILTTAGGRSTEACRGVGRRLDGFTGGRDVNVDGRYASTEASCGVLIRPTV